MRFIAIGLINLYQRFLSPRKGFSCAHHQLHGGSTCSNAVKYLIRDNGVFTGLLMSKQRFKECADAVKQLDTMPTVDIPCDVGIGGCDVGDCSGGGGKTSSRSSCSIFTPLEIIFDLCFRGSKAERIFYSILFISILLITSYWFYGRGISTIYITPLDNSSQSSLITKILERKQPDLRVLLKVNGEKFYSRIEQDVNFSESPIKLTLESAVFNQVDSFEVLDARIKVGGRFAVASQVIDKVDSPKMHGKGKRFSYVMKRRWSFF